MPIRLGVEALREQIDSELTFWCHRVADETDTVFWRARGNSTLGKRVHEGARFLSRRIDQLLELPAQAHPTWTQDGRPTGEVDYQTGADGALCLLELHYRTALVGGRTPLVHRSVAPCPGCHRNALVRENGKDESRCEACGKVMKPEEYDWFVKVNIENNGAAS